MEGQEKSATQYFATTPFSVPAFGPHTLTRAET